MTRLYLLLVGCVFSATVAYGGNGLTMNGQKLSQSQITALENAHGIKTEPADVWCDPISGLWGLQGQSAMGVMLIEHCYGKLSGNASAGNTGIYINDRQLNVAEALYWARILGITTPLPGRYRLSSVGVLSGVNPQTRQPFAVNILQGVAQAQHGGSTFRRNFYTGIGSGSSGGCSYVMGSDFSVTTGNC